MKDILITAIGQIKKDKRYQFLNKNGRWVLINNYWSTRYHVAIGKEVRESIFN